MAEGVRIDKWLWSVRIYKTRSKATDACRSGKVSINEQAVKPSKEIEQGDIIEIRFKQFLKKVEVLKVLSNRVGAKLVELYFKDLTPQKEYDKLKMLNKLNNEFRPQGLGRPTKKQRRNIDKLKEN